MTRHGKRLISALLLLVMLCACAARQDEPAPEIADPRETPDITETADEIPEESPAYDAAYAAYLEILLGERETILNYDWQKGFDDSWVPLLRRGDSQCAALLDVCGDETPELLFARAGELYEGEYAITADLVIYGCDETGGAALLYQGALDYQIAGGTQYRLFQSGGEKSLWQYISSGDEYWEFRYEKLTQDAPGAPLTVSETYLHATWPAYDEDGDFSGFAGEYRYNDAEISAAVFEDAAARLESGMDNLIMHNDAFFAEDETENIRPMTALTCDEAIEELYALLGTPLTEDADGAAFFASLPDTFLFLSGAGGWATQLTLNPDGSFTGEYHDSEMGITGPGYDWTVYICHFSGRFTDVRRTGLYRYTMRLTDLTQEETPDEEWIEDDGRYIGATPYGLENAEEIEVYAPGAATASLPEDYMLWASAANGWGSKRPRLLPFWGLYSPADEAGFISWEEAG